MKKDTLFDFRCWLNKKFAEGKINNISKIEHLIDIFEKGKKEKKKK